MQHRTLHIPGSGAITRHGSTPVLTTFFLSLAALYFFFLPLTCKAEKRDASFFKVTKVHDGDTVSIAFGSRTEKVRLIGIDAPETGQKPWGSRAKHHLESIIEASKGFVFVEFDVEERDKYGRLLAYLRGRDGRLINEKMLRDGYAVLFTSRANVKYVEDLRRAQKEARERGLGIWGRDGLSEMPREYKKEHPRQQ